jgi:hypothetical protein
MSSRSNHLVESQLPLLELPASPDLRTISEIGESLRMRGHDQVTIDLLEVGPCLRRTAALRHVSVAVLVRRAILSAYGGGALAPCQDGAPDPASRSRAGPIARVTLRLTPGHAAALAARARASDVARGDFICALLDGTPPAPLPPDHAVAVQALMASTDHLAVLSTDLNAFMRILERVPVAKLEPFRTRLGGLIGDVRKHLTLSAALAAELGPPRRRIRR